MIKALEITPLNTSKKMYYKCNYCEHDWIIELEGIVNIDEDGKIIEEEYKEERCEKCNKIIKEG